MHTQKPTNEASPALGDDGSACGAGLLRSRTLPTCAPSLRTVFAALLAFATVVSAAAPAAAGSYKGWGDTGWSFDNKRDCCEEAVWLAQEDSIARCERTGGWAKVCSGSTRGLCDWDARGNGDNRVYRCTAEASLYCR